MLFDAVMVLAVLQHRAERGGHAAFVEFGHRKGAKFLFNALPHLEKNIPNYRLVVVGTGWMKQYYDAQIPLNLRKRVHFAGYASPEDLPRYYKASDLYCSPATGNESFGIVLLEAMACGTPIVASDIEGYRAVMAGQETGMLVAARDSSAIAAAIATLAKDPERRRKMGEAGRKRAAEFSWPSIVDRIEAVYAEAQQKKDRPG